MLMELGARAGPGRRPGGRRGGARHARWKGARLCITAEGRIDAQTLRGKVVSEAAAALPRRRRRAASRSAASSTRTRLPALDGISVRTLEQGDLEAAGAELAASVPG